MTEMVAASPFGVPPQSAPPPLRSHRVVHYLQRVRYPGTPYSLRYGRVCTQEKRSVGLPFPHLRGRQERERERDEDAERDESEA